MAQIVGKKITEFRYITQEQLDNDSLRWVVGDDNGTLFQPTIRQLKDLFGISQFGTFQQVLDAGSTLTKKNTVALGANDLVFTEGTAVEVGKISVNINKNGLLVTNNASSTNYGEARLGPDYLGIYAEYNASIEVEGYHEDTPDIGKYYYSGNGQGAFVMDWMSWTLSSATESAFSVHLDPNTNTMLGVGKGIWYGGGLTFEPFFTVDLLGKGTLYKKAYFPSSFDFSTDEVTRNGVRFLYRNGDNIGIGNTYGVLTTGVENVVIGANAGTAMTSSNRNVIIGYDASKLLATSGQTVAIGWSALTASTGTSNVGIGFRALIGNTGGTHNTAIGAFVMQGNTTGIQNVAIGVQALDANTTGNANCAVGYWALLGSTTGWENTAVGTTSLRFNTTGSYNTGIGRYAGYQNNTGNYNTSVGYQAHRNAVGSNNVAVGTNAGGNLTSGDGNFAIGSNTNYPAATGNNQLNICNRFYDTGNGNIGVLTTAPTNKFDVNGDVRVRTIVAGASGVDSVLVVDANGVIKKISPTYYGIPSENNLSKGFYKFSIATTAGDPGAGYMRMNTTNPATVTNFYLDILSQDGTSAVPYLANLRTGNSIYIQDMADAGIFARYNVTGTPVNNTGYWTVPVAYDSGVGTFVSESNLMLVTTYNTSGGGGGISSASNGVNNNANAAVVELGGNISKDTTLSITGSSSNSLRIDSSTSGVPLRVTSNFGGGTAVSITAGVASPGGAVTGDFGAMVISNQTWKDTENISKGLVLFRNTAGKIGNGMSITFKGVMLNSASPDYNKIISRSVLDVANITSFSTELAFTTVSVGTEAERLLIKSTGQMQFVTYTGANFNGTPVAGGWLGVDSSGNIVKGTPTGVNEAFNSIADAATMNINYTLGINFVLSGVTGARNITFSNAVEGRVLNLKVISSSGGNAKLIFPAGTKIPAGSGTGTTLDLSPQGGAIDIVNVLLDNTGTYFVTIAPNFI